MLEGVTLQTSILAQQIMETMELSKVLNFQLCQ